MMKSALAALAAAALIVGCGAAPKRGTTLIEDVRGYNDGVRWQHHALAAQRIHPRERDAFLAERTHLDDDLRVGDYEVVHVRYAKSKKRAAVTVRYVWHLDSNGLVRKTTTRQKWAQFGKRWLMVDEHRVYGDEMPGVAEPPPPKEDDDTAKGADKRVSKSAPKAR